MRQKVYSKGKGDERSVIFKEEDDDGRESVTEEEERITIKGESTEIKISEV